MHNPLPTRLGRIGLIVAFIYWIGKLVVMGIERAGDLQFVAENRMAIMDVITAWWFPLVLSTTGLLAILAASLRHPAADPATASSRGQRSAFIRGIVSRAQFIGNRITGNRDFIQGDVSESEFRDNVHSGPDAVHEPGDALLVEEQPALTFAEVSERQAFVAQARAALEQLEAASDSKHNSSIYAGFLHVKHATEPLWDKGIMGPTDSVERLALEATGELLERHHQSVSDNLRFVSGLRPEDASPDTIRQVCNGIRESFYEYQRLLGKLATLSSQYSGRPDLVWPASWSAVSGGLGADYSEVVRRLKDLRSRATPSEGLRELLPTDHNMKSFDELYRWSA